MKHLKTVHTKRAPGVPVAPEDLAGMSRALYGLARAYDADAAEQDNESVEDVLLECPDKDAHEWLKERRGWLDQ